MADPENGKPRRELSARDAVSLEEGIALLEKGEAISSIRVDFGAGVFGTVLEGGTLDGLLQRARGVRLIKMMAEHESVERPAHMRNGKPVLTPVVEEILDALRPAG